MANWSDPNLTDAYSDFLDDLVELITDSADMFNSVPSNQPDHVIKLLRSPVKFQEWLATAWNDLVLDVTGGGTGSATASGARTNLGLGTMSTQDSTAVSISGGAIDSAVLTGTITQARLGSGSGGAGLKALFDDQTYKTVNPVWSFLAKSANYTVTDANLQNRTTFMCTSSFILTLPDTTVAGNDGQDLGVVNESTGIITITAHAGDTILGASSWSFDFGQYSSVTLRCNKNSNRWEVL